MVDNEVLILLGDELDAMGTCLENFGLPVPDRQSRIQKVPRAIQEEMFDAERQKDISEVKCQSLNSDQQEAFHAVMKAVNDEDHSENGSFLMHLEVMEKHFSLKHYCPQYEEWEKLPLLLPHLELRLNY